MIANLLALAILAVGASGSNAAQGVQEGCLLRNVRPVEDPALRYGRRGNRCEGVFAVRVGGSIRLQLLGFHVNRFSISEVGDQAALAVMAPADIIPALTLRVQSTRYRSYYAMDTAALSPQGGYMWNAEVLQRALPAPRLRDLVGLACTAMCDPLHATYYPLTDGNGSPRSYEVIVLSEKTLSGLAWTARSGGEVLTGSMNRLMPAEVPFTMSLGALPPGIWDMTANARANDGSRTELRVTLIVP